MSYTESGSCILLAVSLFHLCTCLSLYLLKSHLLLDGGAGVMLHSLWVAKGVGGPGNAGGCIDPEV